MSCASLMGLLLVAIGGFKEVQAAAVMEIVFGTYSAKCEEHLFGICDPYFQFFLHSPKGSRKYPRYYGNTALSGSFTNAEKINFYTMTNIKGIPNPWIVNIEDLKDNRFLLNTRIKDSEVFFDRLLATWDTIFTATIFPTKEKATWTHQELKHDIFRINIKYRVYCRDKYYGDICSQMKE